MAAKNTPAVFRIVLQKAGKKDDVLKIYPSPTNLAVYDAEFRQETVANGMKAYLKPSGVLHYVELFLDSVLADENGYTCIQIDCPAFPSVILYLNSIHKYMPILRVQLGSIVENWPVEHLLI